MYSIPCEIVEVSGIIYRGIVIISITEDWSNICSGRLFGENENLGLVGCKSTSGEKVCNFTVGTLPDILTNINS